MPMPSQCWLTRTSAHFAGLLQVFWDLDRYARRNAREETQDRPQCSVQDFLYGHYDSIVTCPVDCTLIHQKEKPLQGGRVYSHSSSDQQLSTRSDIGDSTGATRSFRMSAENINTNTPTANEYPYLPTTVLQRADRLCRAAWR